VTSPRKSWRLLGAGLVLTTCAGVMAVTTDREGRGPVVALAGVETPYLKIKSVGVTAQEVSLAWVGNGKKYRVTLGDDLESPAETIITTGPSAVIAAPTAADPKGRVNFRVEALDDQSAEVKVEGSLNLLPATPEKPKVKAVVADGAVVHWPAAEYATTYDIAVSNSKEELPAQAQRLTVSGTSFATDQLKPDSTYWVRVRAVGEAGVSEFGPATKITTPPAATQVTVGSWNICSEACSGFGGRVGGQAAQVHASGVDVMTLQEAGGKRVGGTTKSAFSGGPLGLVPAEGGGNSRYIFYSSKKYNQLAGGRWPIGNGRWAAWARLQDKETEQTFVVLSVHLLTGNNKNGPRASQMRTLLSRLASVNSVKDPVVMAGDFNSGTHRRADTVGPIVRGADYRDTVEVASDKTNAQVNTGSRKGNRAIMSADHVDHIYVSEQWSVPSWRQWANLSGTTYVGKWLSDHNMIGATVILKPKTDEKTAISEVVEVPVSIATSAVSSTES